MTGFELWVFWCRKRRSTNHCPEGISILAQKKYLIDNLISGEFQQLQNKDDDNERFQLYLNKTFNKTASLIAHRFIFFKHTFALETVQWSVQQQQLILFFTNGYKIFF